MEAQGKHVIIFIFGTALVAAIFAWSFQYMRGRRILELWGTDNARLIRVEGEQIQLLSLSSDVDESMPARPEPLVLYGESFTVVDAIEISNAPGIIHARQALIEDASFQWEKPRADCQPDWQYALEFRQKQRVATILLDMHCERAKLLENGNEAAIHPKIFAGWRKFIDEQLAVAHSE